MSVFVRQTEKKIHTQKKKNYRIKGRKNRAKEREGEMKVARSGEINKKG